MKSRIAIITVVGVCFWHSTTNNKKYNNISKKLDMIVEVSNKEKIDSLQGELTFLGGKLDSMILKYDYGFEFTN